jgi:thiol-disulfide isomerase/thioredoxin
MAILAALLLGGIATSVSAADSDDAVDLDAYRGKVVLLDFWASWCAPCRSSFPWMNEMQEKYADDGLVVIAVNLDNERGEAADFLEQNPAGFEIAYDPERSMARAFGVDSMPNSFLIDRSGRVRAQHRGFRVADQAAYESAIVELLGAVPSSGAMR